MSTNDRPPVWFITGCSTGFGLELTRLVLARGWRAVLTTRTRLAGDAWKFGLCC